MNLRAMVLFSITASLWGASYLFIKVALDDGVSEGFILFVRVLLGAAVLLPLAIRAKAIRTVLARKGWLVLFASIQVIVPFALIVIGENRIESGLAAILIAAAPIFLALFALVLDPEERSTGLAAVGVAIGMAGVVLLFIADIGGVGSRALVGGLVVLGAAAVYGVAPLIYKRRFVGVPHVGALGTSMAVAAVVYLPAAATTFPTHSLQLTTWLSLIVLGAGGTGVAFYCFYEMIDEIGPARSSVVAYVAPLFAVLYGVVLLDERFTVWTLSGMALILGGSWFAAARG